MLISANISSFNYLPDNKENIARQVGFKHKLKDAYKNEVFGIKSSDFLKLNEQERAKIGFRKTYALTGYTRGDEAKVSIIGKLKGYDPNFTSEQIADLKQFINDSGGLFVEYIPSLQINPDGNKPSILRDGVYTIDEILDKSRYGFNIPFLEDSLTTKLLDSDLSVDEFKNQWARYIIKERFGIELSDKDTENELNILKEQKEKNVDTNRVNNKKLSKPIQVNRDSITYDITKDEKFAFKKELLKQEQKRGIDVLFLTQKLEENSEKVIDKKV